MEFVSDQGQNGTVTKKLTFNEAAKRMRAAKLEPLEDYPGRHAPWKCKCLQCGKEVTPSLGGVIGNGGGCKSCGMKRGTEKRKTNSKEAIQLMIKAGVKPLEEYVNSKHKWRCKCLKCGKEISPIYGNIFQGHSACVYCSGKLTHPDDAVKIMKKAGLEPLVPYPGSNTPWKCIHKKCSEIVKPRYSDIIQGGFGCKACGYLDTKKKQLGDSDAAKAFFLSKGFKPLLPYPGSGRPWKSKCEKCGQISSPHYASIKSGTGCGVCAGKIVIPVLAIKVMMKANLKPLEPYPGSKKPWKCKCLKCGKEVSPKYGDINMGYGGCKYCSGRYVSADDAIQVMLFANIQPLVPYKNSGTKWESKCLTCAKKIDPTYNSVQQRGTGCKYCAKRFVDAEDAIIFMRKNKLEPLEEYPGSQKAWRCKCLRCGREVTPAYTSIQGGQKGCVYCGGKKVDPEEAFQMMLKAGLQPLEPYKRADGYWKCRCMKCLKEVNPRFSAINKGNGGCVYCAGKKVDPQDAVTLLLENSLKPLEPFEHTEKKWKCECMKCGRIVYPRHHMIKSRSGGCKYCSTNGLDFTLPAYIYLITHTELNAHKIGISGEYAKKNRLQDHARQGWKIFKKKTFLTADETYEVEQAVLLWLREERGLGPYLSKEEMPQSGWTETVDALRIDLLSIWAKVEELSRVKR